MGTATIATATLSKWGNSQGVRIPKEICDIVGARLGATANIRANQEASEITLTFEHPNAVYNRNRKVSMQELCESWSGGKVGEEWAGHDVGAEEVL
jgi:antitoxin component of MazEF toxin-antitoxin module